MRFATVCFLISLLITLIACEDILEVQDITTERITLLAPRNATTLASNTINLNWQTIPEATAYEVQLAQPNFENAEQLVLDSIVLLDTLGFINTTISNISLPNGSYQWRVKGFNSGFATAYTQANFEVSGSDNIDTTPPNTPELVFPATNSSVAAGTVNFSWTREDSFGSPERDSIFIFSDQELQTLVVKGLGANKIFTTNLDAATYFWVVQGFDGAGNIGMPSATSNFTTN